MSDILVTSPYRPFTLPNQFKAVFNGFIYCGTVDAVDPSVSQVQVYLVNESGDKVPIAQPLRTNAGGYLVYNGQPAKFVTDSNHSLLVRDALGNQVWYAPNMASVDPDALLALVILRGTVADVAAGKFNVGDVIELSDRAYGKFEVVLGGTPNGFDILAAGGGNTAIHRPLGSIQLAHLGAKKVSVSDESGAALNLQVLSRAWSIAKTYAKTGGINSVAVSNKVPIQFGMDELVISDTFNVPVLSAGITLEHGTITCSDAFTIGEPLIKLYNPNKNIDFQYLDFNELIFNCRHIAAGMHINKYLKVVVSQCHVVQFKGYGIRAGNWANYNGTSSNYPNRGEDSEGHELQIVDCTLEEYDFTERYAGAAGVGVAIDLCTPDNTVSGTVVSSAAVGIRCAITPNQITMCHFYGVVAGTFQHKTNGGYMTVNNCYYDGCKAVFEDVRQVNVTGCTFLAGYTNTVDNTAQYFEFSGRHLPTGIKPESVNITGNTFNVSRANSIMVDLTNQHSGHVRDLGAQNIHSNNFYEFVPWAKKVVTYASNIMGKTYAKDKTGTWTFDVNNFLPASQAQVRSIVPVQLLITANWQSNSADALGGYIATICRCPSGRTIMKLATISGDSVALQTGFTAVPTISTDGVITVTLAEFYQGAVSKIGDIGKYDPMA